MLGNGTAPFTRHGRSVTLSPTRSSDPQPKPLIPVHGQPMIAAVVRNVRPRCAHRFIFVALAEHLEQGGMRLAIAGADGPARLGLAVDRACDRKLLVTVVGRSRRKYFKS